MALGTGGHWRGQVIWSIPASALLDSGNETVDQFSHGRREGSIRMELRR
jgi:phospholipid/cholesterol/gamma-HCH transport system ATP-binding protein